MTGAVRLLCFRLDGQRYALGLEHIERVVRVVKLTPLAGAPHVVRGVFSLHGRIVPVGDLRRRLGLPDRDVALRDWIVVARTPSRVLGLLVEGETDLVECEAVDIADAEDVLHGTDAVAGIARLQDGLVLIHDLATFLSAGDERLLAGALNELR